MKKINLSILVFVILVVLAPLAVLSKGCKGKIASSGLRARDIVYQCPMHPNIVSKAAGNCPICGMKLTQVSEQAESANGKASHEKRKILYYQHPMRPDITSQIPAKDEMGMDYVPVYEESVSDEEAISIPGHGAIFISPERQQLIGVKTAVVQKKPLVLTIRAVGTVAYDPQLYNTYTEYRQAASAYEKIKESPLPEVRRQSESLLRAATLKLRRAGLSDNQMEQLLKGNQDQANLLLPAETTWVYADIYAYESGLVKPGQIVKITTPAFPQLEGEGQIKTVDSALNAVTRSLRVRIEVLDKEKLLKPEMFVDAAIEVPLGTNLAIPEQALVNTGDRELVFVDEGEGRMSPREVKVGYEANGFYEVLSGLSEGERVISSANFLIDSESRFRAAAWAFQASEKKQAGLEAKQTDLAVSLEKGESRALAKG